MKLHKITIQDVLSKLPDIKKIDFQSQFSGKNFDLLVQAVGFEGRTLGMVEKFSKLRHPKSSEPNFKIDEAILIKYETNVDDNQYHLNELNKFLEAFTGLLSPIEMNNSFDETIRNKIKSILAAKQNRLNVLLDISTMSSRLILLLTRILFQENINLTILFTEAATYYPTEESFKLMKSDPKVALEHAQTSGIGKVIVSPDYNGGPKENQDLVICFPSFTAERTEAVITYIDDLIIKQRDNERLIWIVGEPHLEDETSRESRRNIQIEINRISESHKTYTVCTFDYKKTLEVLDHIYKDTYSKYHVNISDLGSKMQSLGIALFCSLRRDITVYHSEPIKYNSTHYSEGIKDYWMIPIDSTTSFLKQLFKTDTIEVRNNGSMGA